MSDIQRIEQDLIAITKTDLPRNYENLATLNQVAAYIYEELGKVCDTVFYQKYDVNGTTYKNVVGYLGDVTKERIVVGAHYDVCGDQEGADDNASAVVGMLETARLLAKDRPNDPIEFVAYCLEEPPFFRTEYMGSYVHAKSLFDNQVKVKGMICLEMIGYFDERENTQDYPVGFLSWFYGNKGDFIAVVQKYGNGRFANRVSKLMKKQKLIKTKSIKGPTWLQGLDFSDHQNYWKFDYSAVMITDTAFYRNKNYHQKTDTMETLDLPKMAKVIDQVFLTIKNI